VDLHRGVGPGGALAARSKFSSLVGSCGLRIRPPGGQSGGSRKEVFLGGWILGGSRAFQSRGADCAFQKNVSVAGLGLRRGVPNLVGRLKEATDTVYAFDNGSDAGKRIIVSL